MEGIEWLNRAEDLTHHIPNESGTGEEVPIEVRTGFEPVSMVLKTITLHIWIIKPK